MKRVISMTKLSKNNAETAEKTVAPAVETPAVQTQAPSHADTILQLSAQATATKQLADELINANIGLRSQSMVVQHHLNAATALNSQLEADKVVLSKEIESLKIQLEEFKNTKEASQEDTEAAA